NRPLPRLNGCTAATPFARITGQATWRAPLNTDQTMNIILNGEERRVDACQTVLELIEQLGYQSKRIAVERNVYVVPRSAHDSTPLAEGDRLEIVIAVGGG